MLVLASWLLAQRMDLVVHVFMHVRFFWHVTIVSMTWFHVILASPPPADRPTDRPATDLSSEQNPCL